MPMLLLAANALVIMITLEMGIQRDYCAYQESGGSGLAFDTHMKGMSMVLTS